MHNGILYVQFLSAIRTRTNNIILMFVKSNIKPYNTRAAMLISCKLFIDKSLLGIYIYEYKSM
jgi:hypothetical protein